MQVALHSLTRVSGGDAYDEAHRVIPDDLADAFERLGITDWQIWRSGEHLFHLVDCIDFVDVMTTLEVEPANVAWQAFIGHYVDHFEVTGAGYDGMILRRIWSLQSQRTPT